MTSDGRTFYELLGLPRSASGYEILAAYKLRLRTSKGTELEELDKALFTLGDSLRRAEYDQLLPPGESRLDAPDTSPIIASPPASTPQGIAWNAVPYFRRSWAISVLCLVGVFLCVPLVWLAEAIALTGHVYERAESGLGRVWTKKDRLKVHVLTGVSVLLCGLNLWVFKPWAHFFQQPPQNRVPAAQVTETANDSAQLPLQPMLENQPPTQTADSLLITAFVMNENRRVLPTALAPIHVFRDGTEMANFRANLLRLHRNFEAAREAYVEAERDFRENYRDMGDSRRRGFLRQAAADALGQEGMPPIVMAEELRNEAYWVNRERKAASVKASSEEVSKLLEGLKTEQGMRLLMRTAKTGPDGKCLLGDLPSGEYYVLIAAAYGEEAVIWLEPVTVSKQTEVTFDGSNALIF